MSEHNNSSGDERGASLLSFARELEDASRAGEFDNDAATRHRAARRKRAALAGGEDMEQPVRSGSLLSSVYASEADEHVSEGHYGDPRYDRPLWAGPEPDRDATAGYGYQAQAADDYIYVAQPNDPAPYDFATQPEPAPRPRRQSPAPRAAVEARPLIDPRIVGRRVLNSKLLIASTTLAGALLGFVLTFDKAPTFTATAQVRISSQDVQTASIQPDVSGAGERGAVDSQALIISSRPVLEQAVARAGLANDPEFNGKGGPSLDIVAMARGLLSRADAPDSEQAADRAVRSLADRVRVERIGQSYVFNVGVSTESAATSANVANEIARAYVEQASGLGPAPAAVAAAPGELEERKRALQKAEADIEAFRAENGVFGPQGESSAETELSRLNDQLAEARARQIDIKTRDQGVKNANIDMIVTGALPDGVTSNALPELRVQYSAAKQALDSAAVKLGPRHPQLQALQAQLDGAQDQLKAELRGIVAAQQGELRRSVELEQDLSRRLSQLKAQLGGDGQVMLKLRDLEREAEARRVAYENLLPKTAQAAETRQPGPGDARVVAPAAAPSEPSGRSRAVTIASYAAGGFLGGLGLALLLGLADSFKAASQSRRRQADEGALADLQAASTTEAPNEGDMYANNPSYPYRTPYGEPERADYRGQQAADYRGQQAYARPRAEASAPDYRQPAYAHTANPQPHHAQPDYAHQAYQPRQTYAPAVDPYAGDWEQRFEPYAHPVDAYAQPDPYGQPSVYQQPAPQPQWPAEQPYGQAPVYAEPSRAHYPAPAYPPQPVWPQHQAAPRQPAYAPPAQPHYGQPDPYHPRYAGHGYQAESWEPSLDDWRRAAHQPAPPAYYAPPAPQPLPSVPLPSVIAANMSDSIAELRATLRECREAMLQMAAQDARRRY